jgi:AcrR family transcriptional regulator
MARPKEFVEEQALQEALETFQAKGFDGTSIQDLVEAMGINRQSLYDTFGDKENLYHLALERYRSQVPAFIGSFIDGPLPLRRAMAAQFQKIVTALLSPEGLPCFIAQAALGRTDPASVQCVKVAFGQNLLRLEKRFRRAQEEGELGLHHDPAALARFYQNALHGLQVTARSGASREDLDAIIRVNLSILG